MAECENLDDLSIFDLEQFMLRDDISPGQYAYAKQKYEAMNHRLAGNIQQAIQHENACDRIYATLPENLKW